jgi:hypothetical protein
LSIAIAQIGAPAWVPVAGFSYALVGPTQALNGWRAGKRTEELRRRAP